jgi:nucleolin
MQAKKEAQEALKMAEKLANEVAKLESQVEGDEVRGKQNENNDSDSDDDDSSSSSSSDSDNEEDRKETINATKGKVAEPSNKTKENEPSSDSDSSDSDSSDSDSDDDDEEEGNKNNTKADLNDVEMNVEKSSMTKDEKSESDDDNKDMAEEKKVAEDDENSSSDSSDSSSDSDSDDDVKNVKEKTKSAEKIAAKKDDSDSSSESDSSDSDGNGDEDNSNETPASMPPDGAQDDISKKRKDESNQYETPAKKQAVSSDAGETSTRLYIRGLPWKATKDQVETFFQSCGSGPKSVDLPLLDNGRSSGTAIIDFHDANSAAAAMELNGATFDDRWLSIKYSTPKPILAPREPTKKDDGCLTVFIGNLSWEIDEDTLRDAFKDCGEITQVRFSTDRETDAFKGYGHIEFAKTESTDAAVKLAGTEILGRPIRVDYANDRKSFGGGGGRGGFGGGRGSGRGFGRGDRGGRGGEHRKGKDGSPRSQNNNFKAKKSGGIAGFSGTKITFD